MPKFFISYARTDAGVLASRLAAALSADGDEPWLDTSEIEGGAVWSLKVEQAIDAADAVLALLSPGSYWSFFCRAELGRAYRNGKRIIAILAVPGSDRALIVENLQWIDFTFGERFDASLHELRDVVAGRKPLAKPRVRDPGAVDPVVPHVPYFVDRAREMEELRGAILSDAGRNRIGLTALHGMGGVGKTALAAALCHEPAIRDAFPDGVMWVTIGAGARILEKLAEVGRRLADPDPHYASVDHARENLTRLLRDCAILLVIDDVWESEQILPFQIDGSRSRVLFTTRINTIAPAAGATSVTLGSMKAAEAVRLLEKSSGRSDPAFTSIAERVGGLPLALKLAGARLAQGLSALDWLERFTTVASMRSHRGATDRNESVEISIELSAAALETIDRARFPLLGIFREDVPVSFAAAARAWDVPRAEAENTIDELARLALIDVDRSGRTLTLHDVIRLYVREQLGDLRAANARLLTTWNPRAEAWSAIADDGYLHGNLVYHFVESGQAARVHELLRETTDAGRNAWFTARRDAGSVEGYLADLDVAWRLARDAGLTGELFCALSRSSVQSVSLEIPPELVAALVREGIWDADHARRFANQIINPADQVRVLLDIARATDDPKEILIIAFRRAHGDRALRQEALVELGRRGHASDAVALIADDSSEELRGDAAAVMPFTKLDDQRTLLALAHKLDEWAESEVVAALLDHVVPELRDEAVERAAALAERVGRGRTAGKLLGRAVAAVKGTARAAELMPAALEAIFGMPDGKGNTFEEAAEAIVAAGFTEQAVEKLEIYLVNAGERGGAVRTLARLLPDKERLRLVRNALASIRESTWSSSAALGVLFLADAAPEMRDELVEEACALAVEGSMSEQVFPQLLELLPSSAVPRIVPSLGTMTSPRKQLALVEKTLRRDASCATLEALDAVAAAMSDQQSRGEMYAAIARFTPEGAAMRRRIDAALQRDKDFVAWAHAAVAALSLLEGAAREAIITDIFAIADHAFEGVEILESLAATGTDGELQSIVHASRVETVESRRRLIAAVAPRISRDGLLGILDHLGGIHDIHHSFEAMAALSLTATIQPARNEPHPNTWSGIPDAMLTAMFQDLLPGRGEIEQIAEALRLLGIELARRGRVDLALQAATLLLDEQCDIPLLPALLHALPEKAVEKLASSFRNASGEGRVGLVAPLLPFAGLRGRSRLLPALIAACERMAPQDRARCAALLLPVADARMRRFIPHSPDPFRYHDLVSNYAPLVALLPFLDPDELEHAWRQACRHREPRTGGPVLFILASRMPERLGDGIDGVLLMDKLERARFLATHAFLFQSADDRAKVLRLAMRLASSLGDAATPGAMIGCLVGDSVRADDVAETLHVVVSMNLPNRRYLLSALVPHLVRMPAQPLRAALSDALVTLSRRQRSEFFEYLRALQFPLWRAAGGPALADAARDIKTITSWWP